MRLVLLLLAAWPLAATAADSDDGWTRAGKVYWRRDGTAIRVRADVPQSSIVVLKGSRQTSKVAIALTLRYWPPRPVPRHDEADHAEWTIESAIDKPIFQLDAQPMAFAAPAAEPLLMTLNDTIVYDGKPTAQIAANLVEALPGRSAYLVFPRDAAGNSDLNPPPLLVRTSEVKSIKMVEGSDWQPDERRLLAGVMPTIADVPIVRSSMQIKVPALKQDQRMGCVLNGFKIALMCHDRAMSTQDMMAKLGVTSDWLGSNVIPWTWIYPGGKLQQQFQLDEMFIYRFSTSQDPYDWQLGTDKPLQQLYFPPTCSAKAETKKVLSRNWLAHGLLKTYLAKGLPVLISLNGPPVSHVITVLGYDSDKHAYFVNDGFSSDIEAKPYDEIDDAWAQDRYQMFVLYPKRVLTPLKERTYTKGEAIVATGVLEDHPAAKDFLLLKEDEYSNGIAVPRTVELGQLIGHHLSLSGTVAAANEADDGGKKPALFLASATLKK